MELCLNAILSCTYIPPKLIAPTDEAADGGEDVSASIGTIALVATVPSLLALMDWIVMTAGASVFCQAMSKAQQE